MEHRTTFFYNFYKQNLSKTQLVLNFQYFLPDDYINKNLKFQVFVDISKNNETNLKTIDNADIKIWRKF